MANINAPKGELITALNGGHMTEGEAKQVLEKLLQQIDSFPVSVSNALIGEALRIAIEKLADH